MKDMLRILNDNEERLRQTETKEVPADSGFSSFYAKGTFVPVYQGSGTAGTWVYSVQTGFYTRIGNICFFTLSVAVSSRSVAPTGTARIINLPFTSLSTTNSHSAVSLDTIDAYTLSGTITQLTARIPNGVTYIELIEVLGTAPTTASALAATGFGTASFIRCSGHYIAT